MATAESVSEPQPSIQFVNRDLQSAQEIVIDISGSETSNKESFILTHLCNGDTSNLSDDANKKLLNVKLQFKLTIDTEQYLVKFVTSSGMENLCGVADVRYRTAQGFVIIYSIESRESLEQVNSIFETIARVKEVETFPTLLIGFGNKAFRKVSTAEGNQTAKGISSKFIEILDDDVRVVQEQLFNFVKDTINFSYVRDKDVEEEQTKLTERCVAVIGDSFCGKTSFIRQLTSSKPSTKYIETTSCSTVPWKFQDKEEAFLIQLVDTPGNLIYPRKFLNQVQGLILVFSMTSMQSLKQLGKLREQVFASKGVSKLPSVLIGCKGDLPERTHQVSDADIKEYKTKYGCTYSMVISVFSELDFSLCISQLMQDIQKQASMGDITIGEIDRCGPLSKTSRSLNPKKLKPRVVVISEGFLYITSDGLITPKTSKIPVNEESTVELLPTDPANKMFPFEVRNQSTRYYFSAGSEEERSSWVESINANIACAMVAASYCEDVVKMLLWDILNSPDLNVADTSDMSDKGKFKVKKTDISDSDTKEEKKGGLRGSRIGHLVRRKASTPQILPKKSKDKEKS